MTLDDLSSIRVAGIDMGSNSTRLLVADIVRTPDGTEQLIELLERVEITGLAEQVDRRGILLPQAIARTRNALSSFRRDLRELGAVFVLATATSAVRDADNGEAFLGEVEFSYGFRTELLTGDEEAQLSYSGALLDDDLSSRARAGRSLLVDIGGGSTEVVLADGSSIVDHCSFQLGCVRLTEQLLDGADPPAPDAIVRAYQRVEAALVDRFHRPEPVRLAIGVAGTVTTLAMVVNGVESYDRDAVHLLELPRPGVAKCARRLASIPVAQRATTPGVDPRRAPVIVAGAIILECVMRHFDVGVLVASERDILDGIALRAGRIALDEGIEELPEPFGRTPC